MKNKDFIIDKILIVGSRTFDNYVLFKTVLNSLLLFSIKPEIISGGATGADSFAEKFAKNHTLPFKKFKPDWNTYGKKAGILRNIEMLNYIDNKKSMVIAFWDGKSRGTKFTINESRKRKYLTFVVSQ